LRGAESQPPENATTSKPEAPLLRIARRFSGVEPLNPRGESVERLAGTA
jgi:hypothetical protein